MSANKDQHFSMDDLMKPGFWGRQKNRFIGLAVVSAIVLVAVLFFREQGEAKQASGWEAMMGADGFLDPKPDVAGATAGTTAEPWALLQSARAAWADEDFAAAERSLNDLLARFPNHAASQDASSFLEDVRSEMSWSKEHKVPEALPDVSDSRIVKLATSVGEIEVGLYVDEAPEAVREFLTLIRSGGSLAEGVFLEGSEGSYIALAAPPTADEDADDGEDEDADEDEDLGDDEDSDEEAPALSKGIVADRNLLSHYEGAVSFQRRPVVEADATPQVAFYLQDTGYKDNSEVVFGKVTKGLDLLKEAAKREKAETGVAYADPLKVDSYTEGSELQAIESTP